jgi:hypothetical protein
MENFNAHQYNTMMGTGRRDEKQSRRTLFLWF